MGEYPTKVDLEITMFKTIVSFLKIVSDSIFCDCHGNDIDCH